MRAQASFQEILESKISSKEPTQRPSERPKTCAQQAFDHSDPAHLAYLMGHIGQSFFRPTPQGQTSKIYPSRPKPPPPPHSLTEEQHLAVDFFTLHSVALSPAFSQRELKKAFRSLAFKLHPDMNKGAVSAFIELKNNYETLNGLFN